MRRFLSWLWCVAAHPHTIVIEPPEVIWQGSAGRVLRYKRGREFCPTCDRWLDKAEVPGA